MLIASYPAMLSIQMLLLRYRNLVARATLHTVRNESQVGIRVFVEAFDDFSNTVLELLHPAFPLPQAFLRELLKNALSNLVPKLNDLLEKNPLYLPSYVARLLQNPVVRVVPQLGCCLSRGWQHGYVEVMNYQQGNSIEHAVSPRESTAAVLDGNYTRSVAAATANPAAAALL
jgi:hypothetical protein